MNWQDLKYRRIINLYAGDIPTNHPQYNTHVGLSLTQDNHNHINHNLENPLQLDDNSVFCFQSEDVFEHIEYTQLPAIINEIYRVLVPDGFLRMSVPDYRCDILYDRSLKDSSGKIFFDPGGGGTYDENRKKVIRGGHVWFPTHENVLEMIKKTNFFVNGESKFLHYYHKDGYEVKDINYSLGYISRTPDHDKRVQDPRRPMSLVVDLYKRSAT